LYQGTPLAVPLEFLHFDEKIRRLEARMGGFVSGHGFSRALEFLHFDEKIRRLEALMGGLVSGHGFSRAVAPRRIWGFSPCLWPNPHAMPTRTTS
jgi:hypothetical protein